MNLKKRARSIISFLLVAVLFAGMVIPSAVISASAKSVTVNASGMNSVREAGKLIIYTPSFGATTNTNEWGYEVTIGKDNKVTKVGGYNSEIPKDGFVLSGHDDDEATTADKKMKTWLKDNVKVGDYVYYTQSTLVVTVSDTPIVPSSFYTLEATASSINNQRWEDNLVIYNNLGAYTDTNEWGYEVVCTKGTVTSVGGNNSLVPSENGSFVVSGHGKMAEWLKQNVVIGMTVTYNASTLKMVFKFDENSAAMGLKLQIEAMEKNYNSAVEKFLNFDYTTAKTKIDALKAKYDSAVAAYKKNKKSEAFDSACAEMKTMLNELTLLITESRTVEYRGVWVRPQEKTAKEVDDYVQKLYEAGINAVSIETLYDCTMIMPMPKESLFVQNPKFGGFDVLKAYIDSCHKRDMELHIWLPIFYVGHKGSSNVKYSVATKKPNWLGVTDTGENYSKSDKDFFQMLNPADPEVREFLLSTYRYILENYNIDAFELDYIRYYKRDIVNDFGYDKITLDAFKAKYGVTPEFDTSASYWNDWVNFRASFVTEMVKEVRKLIDEVRPSVLLGADVGPNIEEAHNYLYQDYVTWLKDGYLDILHPMSYGEGFEKEIEAQIKSCGENIFISVGLGIFMPEMLAGDMLRQAKVNNAMGADGSTYFEASSYLAKDTGIMLTNSIYRNKAITPTFNKSKALSEALKYASTRIDNIILPLNGVSESEANNIKTALQAIEANIGKSQNLDFSAAETAVNAISNENAKKVLMGDISYAKKIAKALGSIPDRTDVSDDQKNESGTDSSNNASGNESQQITSDSKNKGNNWLVPSVIAVVVLAGVAGAYFIIKKKK